MKGLRLFAIRVKRRMGKWFWVVMALLIPVAAHEIDHMIPIFRTASEFPIGSLDTWINDTWGWKAALWYHNIIVYLGGAAIIILIAIIGKRDLNVDNPGQI